MWGIRKDGSTEVQSLRAKPDRWTRASFARWLRDHGFRTRIEALSRKANNPLWTDGALELVRYVAIQGGAPAASARAFVQATGATALDLDDAIEEAAGRGLIRETDSRLESTARGEAFVLALHDKDHARATRLWLGNLRPNPSRAERAEMRDRLAQLRSDIAAKRREIKTTRTGRKAELARTTEQAKRLRKRVTAAAQARRARIREQALARIDRARAKIAELRSLREQYTPKRRIVKRTIAEQVEEAESEIAHVDPGLVPLWRRTRSQWKGTPHERAERFLEYAATAEAQPLIWESIEATLPTDLEYARQYEAWAAEQAA